MSTGRFDGRVAFVSGGASGIGERTTRQLIDEGGRVAVADIDEDRGRSFVAQLGDAATFVRLDVRDETSWQAALRAAIDRFGALHVLVNSAGISVPANVEDATLEHWRVTMSINADGVFLGCKHGVATMKGFTKTGPAGAIVNLASTLGAKPGSAYVAYSASKAAVIAVTRSTALHCAERKLNIRCNAVMPGATHTPMVDVYFRNAPDAEALKRQFESIHPLGRMGRADDIAKGIAYLASGDADWVTGVALPIDGGFLAA